MESHDPERCNPVHYETSLQILRAGKHLVTDKPLASTVNEALELCDLGRASGLLIVCAPHDMLARQWREARRLVRDGAVGNVAFARVQSSHAGPAGMAWPADPTWFYQQGAGPLLDLGAYGIDRITGILAPARRVSAIPVVELGRLRSGASSCFAGVLTVSDATDSRLTTRFDPEPEDCTPWSVVFTHLSGGALKVAVDPDSGVNCEPEFEVRMTRQG